MLAQILANDAYVHVCERMHFVPFKDKEMSCTMKSCNVKIHLYKFYLKNYMCQGKS